jgi:serine/threonine protein kinase
LFALPVGTQLKSGKYRVGKFLGSGGFGITYKGSDVSAKRVVAIKELFLEGSSRKDCTVIPPYHKCSKTDYEETIKKFEQEGLLLMKFNDPHIVKVLDVFRENNTAYLIDFGTARTFISGISKSMTPIATPLYSPPEAMLSKGQFDQRYDIYSLGALFYFLLTAEDPPTCETVETSDGLDKIQNPNIKNIIRTCMSRQVSNRYTNVSLLITALKDVSKRTKPLLPITTQELQEIFDQKEVNVSETINMVKDSITKWFTNYPGQSIVNLQQRLVFNKMFNYPIYYIVLTTLFEEKKCELKEKPYE